MEPELEPQEVFTWQEPVGAPEAPSPSGPPSPGGPGPAPRARRPVKRAAMALAAAGVLSGVGVGVAAAATSGSAGNPGSSGAGSPGSSGSSGPATPGVPGGPAARPHFGFRGPGGPGGMGMGMGGAIRGEIVRPNPGGTGYQTVDFQVGKASDVSSSSITVTSADGTAKTYSVTTNTLVDAGRDGISNVASGDTVRIEAVVSNGTATASRIDDQTRLASLRKSWGFGPGGAAPGSAPTPPTGT